MMRVTLQHDTKLLIINTEINANFQVIDKHTIDMLLKHKQLYGWEGKRPFFYTIFPHENVI
jgi:hypothetical protein